MSDINMSSTLSDGLATVRSIGLSVTMIRLMKPVALEIYLGDQTWYFDHPKDFFGKSLKLLPAVLTVLTALPQPSSWI